MAVAAAESSIDTVWFIKITSDIDMTNDLIRDSYGKHYFKGHFIEKDNMVKNGYIYKVKKKHVTIFFKESILYLFVRFYDTPKGLLLKYEDFLIYMRIFWCMPRVMILPQLYKQTKKLLKSRNCVFCYFI